MIRLNNIKLLIDHSDDDLKNAILKKLNLSSNDLIDFTLFKRSSDARKRGAIAFIYTVDVQTQKETSILKRFNLDPNVHTRHALSLCHKSATPVKHTSRCHRLRALRSFCGADFGTNGFLSDCL